MISVFGLRRSTREHKSSVFSESRNNKIEKLEIVSLFQPKTGTVISASCFLGSFVFRIEP